MENRPGARDKGRWSRRCPFPFPGPCCHRPSPTYDHEEDTDAISVAGAFLGVGVHQEHHERPKDEEGDIAELEKRRTCRGCQTGEAEEGCPMSKPSVVSQSGHLSPFGQCISPEFVNLFR